MTRESSILSLQLTLLSTLLSMTLKTHRQRQYEEKVNGDPVGITETHDIEIKHSVQKERLLQAMREKYEIRKLLFCLVSSVFTT